jgi:selenide,water dikinase
VLESFAATPLRGADVTVVVDDPVAMYSGMAPGFVAGDYTRAELEIDVRPLADRCDAEVVVARCTHVDTAERRIALEGRDPIPYDLASFNIGSTVAGLDVPGVREHAVASRPLHRLISSVEGLLAAAAAADRNRTFRVAVVGGGVGGVELAFTTQWRLTRETGRRVPVTIIDDGPRILARLPASLVRRVKRLCVERGIEVLERRRVASVSADGIAFDNGEHVDADAVLWVTGPVSHPVFPASPGVRTDERGFAMTRSTLQLEDHDEIFAVGDCATLTEHPQTPKAGVYAVRQGPYVADNLRASIAGAPLRRYQPQSDFLTLLNVGGGHALGTKWGLTFGGRWVMRWKDHIDRKFMHRFQ